MTQLSDVIFVYIIMADAKKKILIAEDERPMARALELKLGNSGFETKAVYDGKEAYDELKENKYDLVLLDLVMPILDGFTVLEKLEEEGIKVPIIVLSNLGQEEDVTRAKGLGAKDYFVKSNISLSDVVVHLNKFFEKEIKKE